MRILRNGWKAILLGSMMALFAGCASVQMFTESVFLMSPQQEIALGEEFARQIEKEYPIYRADPEASRYISQLGAHLVRHAPSSPFAFQFYLVDSEEVNAFAIPGGHLYVQVGLLREVETESELAAVMAHEIGHGVERHGAKSLSRSQFYNMIGQVALGKDAGQLTELAANILESGILLRHSRQDELEADAVSIGTLNRAGIDPNGLVSFFSRLQAMQSRQPGRLAAMFSTHPPTSERIATANARIQALGGTNPNWVQDSVAFRELKKRFPRQNNSQ